MKAAAQILVGHVGLGGADLDPDQMGGTDAGFKNSFSDASHQRGSAK
jgi:hypothetical protein